MAPLALVLGCTHSGDPRPLGAEPAALSAGAIPRGPAPPTAGLPIPSLDVSWTPPMMTAGSVEALAGALAGHDHAVVRLGPRLSDEARAEQLVRALRPEVGQVDETTGGLRPIVTDPEALPLQRREPDEGRPTYLAEGVAVDATAVRSIAASIPDAAVLLAVDDAVVDPSDWQALPAHAVGSCAEPLAALAQGQEQALAELEPFLDHADGVLAQMFRAELQRSLPGLTETLAPYRASRSRRSGEPDAQWRRYECGHAYAQVVEAYGPCLAEGGDEACGAAPRVFLMSGVRVAMVEPDVFVPEGCADVTGVDAVAELRRVGREAAQVAADYLDPAWVALADRLGTVTEVHAALEDICAPRRRRFAEEDLQAARERLAKIGAALSSDDLDGPGATWVAERERLTVPSVGPVQQVLRYDAGPGSPSREVVAKSRALRQFVQARARCRGASRRAPLVALVVDVDAIDVPFVGYFYEEELFCSELPPLREPRRDQP